MKKMNWKKGITAGYGIAAVFCMAFGSFTVMAQEPVPVSEVVLVTKTKANIESPGERLHNRDNIINIINRNRNILVSQPMPVR